MMNPTCVRMENAGGGLFWKGFFHPRVDLPAVELPLPKTGADSLVRVKWSDLKKNTMVC